MPDGYRTQSEDTSYEAECVYFDRLRKMTMEESFALTVQAIEAGRMLALAGLRARFPEASERELRLRLAAQSIDRLTMIRAFGWDPAEHGA